MGNPIKHHGDHPAEGFTIIRNDLIRRSGLTPAESVVLNILLSHADGWEVTQETIAEDAGITRPTVKKALLGLMSKRKLVVQEGKRGHCVFHVHPARDFTEAEIAALATPLGDQTAKAGKESSRRVRKESSPAHVKNVDDKENQLKHQQKNHAAARWQTQPTTQRHLPDDSASQSLDEAMGLFQHIPHLDEDEAFERERQQQMKRIIGRMNDPTYAEILN